MAPEVIQNSEGYNEKVSLKAVFPSLFLEILICVAALSPPPPLLASPFHPQSVFMSAC